MAIHWQIRFKSLRVGTDYTVNIYDSTYSGQPIVLKGGAQPFTTQESDDDDMFIPIRTHTGYLRIVDDGKDADGAAWNWKTLLPSTDTDRPVTLTDGNGAVVWQGFMQSQNFGGVLYGNPQEREFPIQCPLAVLEGTDINYQHKEIENFAYLLQRIVNAIDVVSGGTENSRGVITTNGSIHINNIYVQGNTDAQQWLLKRIDWQNFVDEDSDGNLSARFNLYQCLDDLCRFWGWTARTYKNNLYLTCADDSSEQIWLTLTRANLNTMAGGATAGTTGGAFSELNYDQLTDIFASVEQNDYRQRGANKATVKADGNRADEEFLKFAPDRFCKTMTDGGWQGRIIDDGKYVNYTVDKLQMSLPLMAGTAVSGNASFNVANIQQSLDDEGDEYPVIRIKKTYSSNVYASLETVYHHSFIGAIVLRGEIYRKTNKLESKDDTNRYITYGNKTMVMRLGIGVDREHAKWWNGRTWSNSVTTFVACIGGSDGIFWSKYTTNFGTATSHFYSSSIPATGSGKIFVDFLGSSDLDNIDGQKSFEVSEFSLTISQKSPGRTFGNEEDWVGTREYKSSNQNNGRMEWNSDCIYATDNNMANGFGVLLNSDGTHMTGYDYGDGVLKAPEQYVADRVTNYWATAKRKLTTELRADRIPEPSPMNKVTLDSTTGHPIVISHDWRDDVTKLTIMQL